MAKPYTREQIKKDLVTLTVRLRRDQLNRLGLLQKSLQERMGKELTKSDLLEKIIDDFLEK
jgi:hypothetical protein